MTGRYKYICDECNEQQRITRAERASRFYPRCRFCGSPHLSPVKGSQADEHLARHNAARGIQKDKFQRCNNISRKKKGN